MIDLLPPGRRQVPLQRRSEGTIERILGGAETLICQVPLDFVTVGRIAKAAGVSVGSLYRFFGDKQAVFDTLARKHLKQLRECLENRVMRPLEHSQRKGAGFNQFEFLENVIDTYVSYLEDNEGGWPGQRSRGCPMQRSVRCMGVFVCGAKQFK